MQIFLSPTQQTELTALRRALPLGCIFVVHGETGMGKTTLLEELHRTEGGVLLNMRRLVSSMRAGHPLAMEEAFDQMLREALDSHNLVIVDDFHLLRDVVGGCEFDAYPRKNFLLAPLTTLVSHAVEDGKTLIFGMRGDAPGPIRNRAYTCRIDKLREEDYAFFCRTFLHSRPTLQLDAAKIFRFAPRLNAHQLKNACHYLSVEPDLDTDRFIEYLRAQKMSSNIDMEEIQHADLRDLKGVDDVIRSLETHIVLPLEDDALAQELDIRPKRGVLLAGPPGTGKTTIGRALAHRLKSKFFALDGTFIAGSSDFYDRVEQVCEAAKQNAPSVLFIDDSDVIFADGKENGLYRYLLTMLDGLENETAGRVCVMMTAMNVSKLPPALVRSGRVELWLEMRLPDLSARRSILEELASRLPSAFQSALEPKEQNAGEPGKNASGVDVERLAAATEGLTGADVKRVMEDGKLLYAYDRVQGQPLQATTDYFLAAIAQVRANKARYEEAAAAADALPTLPDAPFLAVTHVRMEEIKAV